MELKFLSEFAFGFYKKMYAILLAIRAGIKHAATVTHVDACLMPFTLWYIWSYELMSE